MEGNGVYRHRRLPHWDLPGATYFVTTCLAGSIPAEGLLDVARYRARLALFPTIGNMSDADRELRCWKKAFARSDDWLDRRPAVRHLADPKLAKIVVNACVLGQSPLRPLSVRGHAKSSSLGIPSHSAAARGRCRRGDGKPRRGAACQPA